VSPSLKQLQCCAPEYTKKILVTNFSKYLFKYIQQFLEIEKPTYFHFFGLKTDNSLFCHRDIPIIHAVDYCVTNAVDYCVTNAVDYTKKNDVLPMICQLN